jgi:hypothetical protein
MKVLPKLKDLLKYSLPSKKLTFIIRDQVMSLYPEYKELIQDSSSSFQPSHPSLFSHIAFGSTTIPYPIASSSTSIPPSVAFGSTTIPHPVASVSTIISPTL